MHAETHLTHSNSRQKNIVGFLLFCSKILLKALVRLFLLWDIAWYVIYSIFVFLITFKVDFSDISFFGKSPTLTFSYFIIPFIVYIVGVYATLLPLYVVLIVMFLPKKISVPITACASFASLFILVLF
jgi:hypothetical protein